MKPRHKRFVLIGLGLLALAVASMLILNAFQSNLVFFFTPTQVANGEVPQGHGFRIGVIIGEKGVERIVEVSLNAEEKAGFQKSVDAVNGLMAAAKTLAPELA